MKITATLILILTVCFATPCATQSASDIARLVNRVRVGEIDEVKRMMPQLTKARPNDPGVLFLQALLETNAEKAMDIYQQIVDKHPSSEWADDALYKLYQYSWAVGAYRTARAHMERLTSRYPSSPFAQRTAEQSSSRSDATSEAKSDAFSVQLGAYSRSGDAEKQVNELKDKGYTAQVQRKEVDGKTVYAVWVGVFNTIEQARAFAERLKQQQNLDAIVVRR